MNVDGIGMGSDALARDTHALNTAASLVSPQPDAARRPPFTRHEDASAGELSERTCHSAHRAEALVSNGPLRRFDHRP